MQNPVAICIDDTNSPPNSAPVSAANPMPIGGGVASGTADSGSPVKVGGRYQVSAASVSDGQRVDLLMDNRGRPITAIGSAAAGSDAFGNTLAYFTAVNDTSASTRLAAIAPSVFNGATWDRQVKANAVSRLLSSAATTNATVAKAAAGNAYKIYGNNTVASKRYLKFYNKATAPTVGTDTPVLTLVLLASAAFTYDFGSFGEYFSAGISYAITGAAADADTTAIGAGDIECMNITYA